MQPELLMRDRRSPAPAVQIAGDGIMILAAHPDDETIGAGAHLRWWRDVGFVHVTDGAPRDLRDAAAAGFASGTAYAGARQRELTAALRLAGCGAAPRRRIGLLDQEAVAHLPELIDAVLAAIREFRPRVIVTHPYEGGHPDHDASAFAAHVAVRLLRRDTRPAPAIVEMASYHRGAGGVVSGAFLPQHGSPTTMVALTPAARAFKNALLDCFATQRPVLQAFRRDVEPIRSAPAYDFTVPPHAGALLYELWGLGNGSHWRTAAGRTLATLRLSGAL